MIKCPRCNSDNLYKFGKDPKTGKQKYQCKTCKRQFRLGDSKGRQIIKRDWLPNCPKCNYRMSIFKHRNHFKRLRCQKCNYKYNVYYIPDEILNYVSNFSFGKTNFKRMRHSKEIILKVIKRHYEFGMSFRDISKNMLDEYGIKISHVTIFMWCRKFALLFKQRTENVKIKLSKTWHIDETVIKIRGKKHWIFAIIDRKTRFVIAWYLSKTRATDAAIIAINIAIDRAGFKPNRLVSDRHPIYQEIKKLKPKLAKNSILVEKFSDKLSNNRIERYFNTFKSYYKRARGLKSFFPVTCFLTMHVVYYNYFRSHSALNNQSPAEAGGFKSVLPDRWCSVFSS